MLNHPSSILYSSSKHSLHLNFSIYFGWRCLFYERLYNSYFQQDSSLRLKFFHIRIQLLLIIIFKFYLFLLKENCFTEFCCFLSNLNMNQSSDQIRSVAQSCPTLCDPMNCSTPGLPVYHQLLEFTETHVHRVSDANQPSPPLSSPSPAPNPSQHQSLFQ